MARITSPRTRRAVDALELAVEADIGAVEAEAAANSTAIADLTCVPTLAYATSLRVLIIEWNIPPADNLAMTPADWVVTVNGSAKTTFGVACEDGKVSVELTADAFYPQSDVPRGGYSIVVAYDGTDTTFVDQVGTGRQISAFTASASKAAFPRFDLAVFTGDSGAGGLTGLVPAPAAGDAAARKFLAAGGGYDLSGHVIEDEGTPVTQRANMNFAGAGVSVADSGGKTVVTIAGGAGEAFPVGSIFQATVSTNPATLLGYGTWAAIEGVFLAAYKAADADFGTGGGTGGAKTATPNPHSGATVSDHAAHVHSGSGDHASHTHTYTDIVNHTHSITDPGHIHTTQRYPTATGGSSGFTIDTSMSGTLADNTLPVKTNTTGITATNDPGGGVATGTTAGPSATLTHGNTGNPTATITHTVGQASDHSAMSILPPYKTVYIWERTA